MSSELPTFFGTKIGYRVIEGVIWVWFFEICKILGLNVSEELKRIEGEPIASYFRGADPELVLLDFQALDRWVAGFVSPFRVKLEIRLSLRADQFRTRRDLEHVIWLPDVRDPIGLLP